MSGSPPYLMESLDEVTRLEIKTDPEVIRKQAQWCGVKPGMRVLDAGCGPGKITSILHELIQPGGEISGIDFSPERVQYAAKNYGQQEGISFAAQDLRYPLDKTGYFDLIWVRFVLEYYRLEAFEIVKNLAQCLKPGGYICLLDIDHNGMNHYELPFRLEVILNKLVGVLEKKFNFDPLAGRKLYSHLYDLNLQNIELELMADHLIYGRLEKTDTFNWSKKIEILSEKTSGIFADYPGGRAAFLSDFRDFFNNPRRFTYAPIILCKGQKLL